MNARQPSLCASQPQSLRVDKWLWHARFFKTRSLSAKLVQAGKLRVNAQRITKPAFGVKPGDVLTFQKETDIRVIRIAALGSRRGPAPEAQTLYEDLDPPQPKEQPVVATSAGPRPDPRTRRKLRDLRGKP